MNSTVTRRTRCLCFLIVFTLARGDDEDRRNTPPHLTTGSAGKEDIDNNAQPRFLPFSASFSLGDGDNTHSLSTSGNTESSVPADENYFHNQYKNQHYGRPYWTNISPTYENADFGSSNPYRPTLQIGQRPQGWSPPAWRRPSQLDISINDNRWNTQVPEVRIYNTQSQGSWNPYSCYRRPYQFFNSREEYEWNSRCGYHVHDQSLSSGYLQSQFTISSAVEI